MLFVDILKLSFFNVCRAGLRTFLTSLSICVGIASVMLISSLGDSGEKLIMNEIEKVGISGITIYSKNTDVSFDDRCIQAIKNINQIELDAQAIIVEPGVYNIKNSEGNAIIWGVENNVDRVISLDLLHGRLPNSADIRQKKQVAVVDTELAQSHYKRTNIVGKNIILTVSGVSESFEIIGVVASQKDGINQMVGGILPSFIYVPYKTLALMRGNDSINQIAIKCENDEDNDLAGEMIIKKLSRITGKNEAYGYENIKTHTEKMRTISSAISLLLSSIAAISLIVAGIGIMNIMLSSARERKKEIGILMAIGADRRDIAFCFLAESIIISGIGGILGCAIGALLSFLITSTYGMPTVFSFYKLTIIVIIAIAFGIVFSILPAQHASKLDPVKIFNE